MRKETRIHRQRVPERNSTRISTRSGCKKPPLSINVQKLKFYTQIDIYFPLKITLIMHYLFPRDHRAHATATCFRVTGPPNPQVGGLMMTDSNKYQADHNCMRYHSRNYLIYECVFTLRSRAITCRYALRLPRICCKTNSPKKFTFL